MDDSSENAKINVTVSLPENLTIYMNKIFFRITERINASDLRKVYQRKFWALKAFGSQSNGGDR